MALKFRVEHSPGQLVKEINEADANIVKAANKALRELGLKARDAGRRAIGGAGFGRTWVNSLQLIMYPKGRTVSLSPVAYVHSKINYSDVFETSRRITPGAHSYIWLPLPHVPPFKGRGIKFGGVVGREHMTPSQFVRFVGPLVTMRRPEGKAPLLGFPVPGRGKVLTAARVRRAGARIAGGAKDIRLVPMYVGVKEVKIPAKFNATMAMNRAFTESSLAQLYLDELDRLQKAKAQ